MRVSAPRNAVKRRKTVGRGSGTGHGCTSGRGNNGQKSRSGYSMKIGFEGGQMPLARRIPKRGFNNTRYEKSFQIVNLRDLTGFDDGDVVDFDGLLSNGLVNRKTRFVKLLGKGEIKKKLHVKVNRISKKAQEALESAGGTVEII
jgi:large subunit ribosomal protein L15